MEIWTGSKKQKEALRQKYDGRCAYCGCVLDKMQADHLVPIIRITSGPYGQRLPASQCRAIRPEHNVVSNMMPSCPPCNNHKGGYRLEEWRAVLARAAEIVGREKSIFRAAVRMGLITVSDAPVVFYFERQS